MIQFYTTADNQPGLIRSMKDWPAKWDAELRRLMPTTTNHQIAKQLGATTGLVGFRIQKLGLTRTPEEQEKLYGNIRGRLVSGMNAANQQVPGTCKWVQKRPHARPKKKGGMRGPDKPEWWIFLGKGERMPLRRFIWERWIGPVPKGHNICFADGNPARCLLSNLICLPNSEMTRYNRNEIKRAMNLRAFWNKPEAKASFAKSAQTRRAFNQTEEGKQILARRSENMKQLYKEGKIRNPFQQLDDKAVAYYIAQDAETQQYILEHRPDLIELKRTELLLKRTIKQHTPDESETKH